MPIPCLGALAVVVAAASLAGCQPVSPQEDAQKKIQGCAAMADEYLDPSWAPRTATGVYPAPDGTAQAVITAQGIQVTVSCGVVSGYYTHMLSGVYKIQGVDPAPGQLYLPTQHRWLTDDELHARLTKMLAPQEGEYAGASWAPNPPAVYTVSDLAGVPSTNCFTLQSKLEPARQLVACEVAAGHRYWVWQATLTLELPTPPAGLPPIPRAPPADLATQPGGVPKSPGP
jgi:hypothetical protein